MRGTFAPAHPHRKRRRGESDEVYVARLRAMWTAEQARAAELEAVRSASRAEGGGGPHPAGRHSPDHLPPLPPLHLVTGWSKARPQPGAAAAGKAGREPPRALFGGWRIEDMKKKLGR